MKASVYLLLSALAIIFLGCPSPPPVKEPVAVPAPPPAVPKSATPEMSITIASLDLSKHSGKIETADLDQLAEMVRRDSIDILALEGITRYPGLSNRIDPVDGLVAATGMRHAFGETMTLNGRQSGNAVFSTYPIRSSENTPYSNLHSTKFEAALQAVIDCGVRDMVIISTLLPENPSMQDQSAITNQLSSFTSYYINQPIVITGNMNQANTQRAMTSFASVEPVRDRIAPKLWLGNAGDVKAAGVRVLTTPLGPLSVARVALFRKPGR